MNRRWGFHRVVVAVVSVLLLFHYNLSFCWCLNSEGLALLRFRERVIRDPYGVLRNWNAGEDDGGPCSWFGVECSSDGRVISLNLKDLCLGGTLAPDIGKLAHIKSIILRNNSFSGKIPEEIGDLMELEVLDLGYNNFSGSFPSDFSNNLSLTTLLLDNNQFLGFLSPDVHELKMISECQTDESQLTDPAFGTSSMSRSVNWNTALPGDTAHRRLQQVVDEPEPSRIGKSNGRVTSSISASPSPSPFSASIPPSASPILPSPSSNSPSPSPSSSFMSPSPSPLIAPTPASPVPAIPPTTFLTPTESSPSQTPSPASVPVQGVKNSSKSKRRVVLICATVVGGSLFILLSVIGIMLVRSSKVVTVRPWTTGLSGQLQKAFVTGVPKLNRSELVAACEDFSNIIGCFSDGNIYKGTLSSGVEIAVTCITSTSAGDWSKHLEAQFRKKIETLSKVNHKNFVNLIGYCEEEKPFTRMMVFEYAPNGTLFEHLHIKEAEHLDWGMRVRVAMGMAYCLEYMHQMSPPIYQKNLQSASIYLTEDYAAKVSDFSFWNEGTTTQRRSTDKGLTEIPTATSESNVYSFGVILFEMFTGRIPYSVEEGSLADWASHYLRGDKYLGEMVDPTLETYQEEELGKLFQVITDCVHPDPKQRPKMAEITARLKDITAIGPDRATPKLSPLWWAELEILSEGN
ncbi:inactive receptor-like serine/threonine-protein kinase At2g40270 [Argentina anserina]|uniref:inactive receptor-like serine/threonine-protein kinase At2g40270 n=1 Tax=Argentina anserina TaxID=57926 RepID=UPI002176274A|nr:inactive receptor-like serine/threonine-protein kinase At2g40270 [Potentilla anserina]XP_050370871.1 inactive receptor-like serine/threonine-protein kinase At2g40270 [Potentilla anserina]